MAFLNVTYINTKSLIFIVLALIAVVWMGYHVKKNWKQSKRAYSAETDAIMTINADTNPGMIRKRIIDAIALNGDAQMLGVNMQAILGQVSTDQQPGGPIYNLIQERKTGTITHSVFMEKLFQYLRELTNSRGIPMGNTIRTPRPLALMRRHRRALWPGRRLGFMTS